MSKKEDWTPGPWRADWDDNGQWYVEPLGVTGRGLRGDSANCIESANAHLMAAAPDLFAACAAIKLFLEGLEEAAAPLDPLREIRRRVHAPLHAALDSAMAKARGESA